MTIKILVSDKIFDEGIKILQEKGFEVTCAWDMPKLELPKIISEYDVLIVRSATKVKGELLDNAKKLKVIGRAGEGLDNIDFEKAQKLGICVSKYPTCFLPERCGINNRAYVSSIKKHCSGHNKSPKRGMGKRKINGT